MRRNTECETTDNGKLAYVAIEAFKWLENCSSIWIYETTNEYGEAPQPKRRTTPAKNVVFDAICWSVFEHDYQRNMIFGESLKVWKLKPLLRNYAYV